MNKQNKAKIQVFYDGACGLCAREINHYKTIAPTGVFEWVDVMHDASPFEAIGYTKQDGLKALHVRDQSGEMHIGIDAFAVIWAQMRRWRVLAFFIKLPIIHHIARLFYRIFAAWRFKKLGYQ